MWGKITAIIFFIMMVSAAALDSADWKTPLIIFLISGVWCAVYAVLYSYKEV